MKNLWPLGIVAVVLFLWCICFPVLDCYLGGKYTITSLNLPSRESAYKLPHNYKLLFNKCTDEYEVNIQDIKWTSLDSQKLRVYSQFGLNNDLWSTVNEDNATRFKDSSIAKYYAHLWYNNQIKEICKNSFKPLTK